MIFFKKYMEIWRFLYIPKRWYFFFLQTWNYPSFKKAKMTFSRKIHLNMTFHHFFCTEKDDTHPRWDDIVILDGYSERAKMIPCTFMETLLGVFIYCFPMKKNQKTWYIGLKFDFICKLYSWRYSAMKNLQYSV